MVTRLAWLTVGTRRWRDGSAPSWENLFTATSAKALALILTVSLGLIFLWLMGSQFLDRGVAAMAPVVGAGLAVTSGFLLVCLIATLLLLHLADTVWPGGGTPLSGWGCLEQLPRWAGWGTALGLAGALAGPAWSLVFEVAAASPGAYSSDASQVSSTHRGSLSDFSVDRVLLWAAIGSLLGLVVGVLTAPARVRPNHPRLVRQTVLPSVFFVGIVWTVAWHLASPADLVRSLAANTQARRAQEGLPAVPEDPSDWQGVLVTLAQEEHFVPAPDPTWDPGPVRVVPAPGAGRSVAVGGAQEVDRSWGCRGRPGLRGIA